MTTTHDQSQRVRAGRPALTRLLAVPTETFAEQHWGRDLLLSSRHDRAAAHGGRDDDFADLFSLDAVDELISRRGLRAPFVRLAKAGRTHPDSAFTAGGGIGAGVGDQVSDDKILSLFAEGSTLVLQGLHRTWGPVIDFSQQLAADLGHPVQVNAYITPAQNQGFSDHYDIHDVFVLQVHGEKRWLIHDPVLESPLRDQPWADRADEVAAAAAEPPRLDTVLSPGDCLYLPRGFIHAAQALGGVTAHLTIGVQQWTRHHLAEQLLRSAGRRLGDDAAVRGSLPFGVDVADTGQLGADVEQARQALLRAIEAVPTSELAEAMRSRVRDAQRAAPVPPLAQLAALEEASPDTVLTLRPHLVLDRWPIDDGQLQVRSRSGRFRMPADHEAALERLLTGEPVAIGDLDADPAVALRAGRLFLRAGIALVHA